MRFGLTTESLHKPSAGGQSSYRTRDNPVVNSFQQHFSRGAWPSCDRSTRKDQTPLSKVHDEKPTRQERQAEAMGRQLFSETIVPNLHQVGAESSGEDGCRMNRRLKMRLIVTHRSTERREGVDPTPCHWVGTSRILSSPLHVLSFHTRCALAASTPEWEYM